MFDKTFDPQKWAKKIYDSSLKEFSPKPHPDGRTFCLMMPPPNVTGSLHLGHALTYTLQDIIVRFKRMQGFETLYQPGTDHAGIATQIIVERQLGAEGLKRHDLGREKFIEKVWAWREESGNTIVDQQRHLAISPHWALTRFTMDEGLSKAVTKVFVELYNQGLIYRDKRLVNWDTVLQTAVSDLEVDVTDVSVPFYHITYPLADNPQEGITVATTRPETLFGDVAVAVNPKDERFARFIGLQVKLPLTDRTIPVIGDDYCDPEMGTGAVKITPGHDFNDFTVGQRHGLEPINILTAEGRLNDNVPIAFRGLSTDEARKQVTQALDVQGLLIKTEILGSKSPLSQRTGVEIQPWLTDQWFVDAKTLAEPALKVVEEGKIEFIPANWVNTYNEWLNNIQPWCISRQIWWGHQIPAWYGPDGHIFVAENEQDASNQAFKHYGREEVLNRDGDVLDTWFSSALWPFTTLGWPEETPDLKQFYPTDVLVTGFDILFFWVARMIMMGLHFRGDVPFRRVYMHALVRDEKGQKMSKSKGNVIDPMDLIHKYGSDALRFTLGMMAAPGRDIKIGESRVESTRNFITKIWNAAKFLEMNACGYNPHFEGSAVKSPLNQWIISKLCEAQEEVTSHLEGCRFDLAAQALYHFIWGTYCDVYIETLKPVLNQGTPQEIQETKETAAGVFVAFVKLLHPYMPIVTEVLWQEFYKDAPQTLTVTPWLEYQGPKAENHSFETHQVEWALLAMSEIRSLRGLLGVNPALKIPLGFLGCPEAQIFLKENFHWIAHLARLGELELWASGDEQKPGDVPLTQGSDTFYLRLGNLVDWEETQKILQGKIEVLNKEISHLEKKLANDAYKMAKPDKWAEDAALQKTKMSEHKKLEEILGGWG
jgi:valyl-tRNA synthetase